MNTERAFGQKVEAGTGLEGALQELRGFGLSDPEVATKAEQLAVGESLMGDLPGGGWYTLWHEGENSYRVQTEGAQEKAA